MVNSKSELKWTPSPNDDNSGKIEIIDRGGNTKYLVRDDNNIMLELEDHSGYDWIKQDLDDEKLSIITFNILGNASGKFLTVKSGESV